MTHVATPVRAGSRPLSATIWFVWMVAMWGVFLVLLAADRLDGLWSWIRGLPLLVEGVLWIAFLPWLLATAVWTSSWSGVVRVLLVCCFAVGWTLSAIPRARREAPRGAVGGPEPR
ncbi:MAG TPA: hypothetical protein VK874_07955 [Gaiellaceae bacterium]|nr:hypothetical protein [Gaiellaceae bacterium]